MSAHLTVIHVWGRATVVYHYTGRVSLLNGELDVEGSNLRRSLSTLIGFLDLIVHDEGHEGRDEL